MLLTKINKRNKGQSVKSKRCLSLFNCQRTFFKLRNNPSPHKTKTLRASSYHYIAKINLKTKKYVDKHIKFQSNILQHNFKEIQNTTYCILQKYSTKKQLVASCRFRRKKTGGLTRKTHSILKYDVCQYF
jgi:hypothetical protein